ncbi:MAG: hypothetical protein ACQETE_15650 [Bacteroidota bacterium]
MNIQSCCGAEQPQNEGPSSASWLQLIPPLISIEQEQLSIDEQEHMPSILQLIASIEASPLSQEN